MVSCNDVLMQIVSREGKEIFYKYQDMFGFTEKTGIDLPGEADTSGLGYTVDTAGPVDMATNSFGQNYNCTMVQMAAAYCSVLNGGSYYQPHVVKQILNSQGSVVKKVEPVLVRETVSQSTSDFIRDALFQTVYGERGTGKAAQVAGYELGGKTGTAEKLPRGSRNYVCPSVALPRWITRRCWSTWSSISPMWRISPIPPTPARFLPRSWGRFFLI